jgi:ABC-type lipoprotein export system ATPase subunit
MFRLYIFVSNEGAYYMKLIQVDKIYHNRENDVHALKEITLDLNQTGFTMILGPSGCGKTTLLNAIAGRESCSGTIEDVPNFDYLTQDFNLFDEMSIMDNLLLVSHDTDLIMHYLNEFSLSSEKNRKIKKLSNGEKKRVQFIRALLHQPGLLLCDEPTAALDHENIVILMEELKKISSKIQIIMVTHDTALAEQYGDRIITLDQGTVVKDEMIHEKEQAGSGHEIQKKNIAETISVSSKELVSRISDSLVTVVLMVLCITTAFSLCNLQANVSRQNDYQSVFEKAENMTVSVPKEQVKNTGETFSGYTMKYSGLTLDDLFDHDQIEKLIQDTPEIIGVESWNSRQYADEKGELEYLRAEYDLKAYHRFTADGLTHMDGTPYEQADYPEEQPYMVSNDSKTYRNLQDYVNATAGNVELSYPDHAVDAFDLVNGYTDLPLVCGEYPKEQEVLLDQNAADMYMKLNDAKDYEDLVGKTLSLEVIGNRNKYEDQVQDNAFAERITMKIAGVSSIKNNFASMIFFNSGYGSNPLYRSFVEDVHNMKTEYVRFLLKPGCDYEEVSQKINDYFAKDNVVISQFKGQGLGKDQAFYASPAGFMVYGFVVLGILVLIAVVILVLKRRRMRKEMGILHSYGYSSLGESLIRYLILTVISCLLTFAVIVPLIKMINSFASAHYYQPFMSFNVGLLFVITLITCIIMYALEVLVRGKGTNAKN